MRWRLCWWETTRCIKPVVCENVCDRWESVVGLCRRYVVDVTRLAKTARTVLNVACEGVFARLQTSERLVHRRRLYDPIVCELCR